MDPGDSIERYDRQIRLWGQHGQSKCSNSKICLVNANSLGTEILKGLCLAGIGSFTILDSHRLLPEDLDCNFLSMSCIGKNRGESVKSMLLDLNEEVIGEVFPVETYLPQVIPSQSYSVNDLSRSDTRDLYFWKQFNCIIICGFLYVDQVNRLSKICWEHKIPMIRCKSIGFYGFMRCQIREHLIIETHSDNPLPNFNLDKPFEDLENYFDSIDLNDSSQNKINSYPYIVIIYKHLRSWQKRHNYSHDRMPNCYAEKQELKKEIQDSYKEICNKSDNKQEFEASYENYLEAAKAINSSLTTTSDLPQNVKEIFDNEIIQTTSNSNGDTSSMFWLIIKAIREFVLEKNNGRLPVSGTLPDMISSSKEYLKVQGIYRKKAKEDVDTIASILQNSLNTLGVSGSLTNGSLYEEIKLLTKNIRNLQIITTTPIYEENDFNLDNANEEIGEDEHITIGLSLEAMDLFYTNYGRLPGCNDDQVETDVSKLRDCFKHKAVKIFSKLKTLDQCLYELCRYGGAEIHATSAFLGGCIGQEVIKIITNQYTPVNDSLVYNAITASTKEYKFFDGFEKR